MNLSTWWKQFSHSRGATIAVVVVAELFVVSLVFHAGISYGERSVFNRMHAQRNMPGSGFLPPSFMPEGHGGVGTISAIAPPTLTLQERDGDQEQVIVSSSTIIHGPSDESSIYDLRVGEGVIVLGDPNETAEQISARLIRVLPPANQ